jgi:hypothetical protein
MKNPTATDVWNLRIIIVPPIQRNSKTSEDHMEIKASVPPRDDMAKIEMRSWIIDMPRMKYLIDRQNNRERERNDVWSEHMNFDSLIEDWKTNT